jgi:hypothetical protein
MFFFVISHNPFFAVAVDNQTRPVQFVSQSWMETRTLDPTVANASSFGIFLACQKVANNNRLDPDCIWMTQQAEMKAKSVIVLSLSLESFP